MALLESLPNELLLLIFAHLHKFNLLYAFGKLNQRFQQIVQPYLSDVDLTGSNFPSYQSFRLFYEHLLPDNAHHIRSLTLIGYHQLQLLRVCIRQFINLTTLTIKNGENGQQQPFLMEALSLPSLSELTLTFAHEDILDTISACALPSLRRMTLIYSYGTRNITGASLMPHLRRLSVYIKSIEALADLFTLTPNLEELNLSTRRFNVLNDGFQLVVPKTVTRLSLEFGYYNEAMASSPSLEIIRTFLDLFSDQLRSFTLIGINVREKAFSDYERLQSLVEKFTHLEKFEYHINTNQHPDANSRFPHVEHLPDMTYSIYTHPKLQPFDTASPRVTYINEPHSYLTPRQLFNSRTLKLSVQSVVPTSFELKEDLLLKNLKKIDSDDPIAYFDPEVLQYVAEIVAQAPNLDAITLWSWHGSSSMIEPCRVMFPHGMGARITHTGLSIGRDETETPIPYSTFVSEVAALFPNTKKLKLHVEQEQLNGCYNSFAQLIDDVRRNFKKITGLEVNMWLQDQPTFDGYIQDLIELNNERSLHHTVFDRHDKNDSCTFLVWL